MADEHSPRGQSAEDVFRQARISHCNNMSLHVSAPLAAGHKLSMARIQYELGTTLPYDYVSMDAGNTEHLTLVMPKTIMVKATPRFGAVMMAASSAAAAGPGPGTTNTGDAADAAAAMGPNSAPTSTATIGEVNSRGIETAAAPTGPPPEVGEGHTADEGSSDDANAAAAVLPEPSAARAPHRADLGLCGHAAEAFLFLPNRSASTTNQALPPGLETAALRGRLRRMSATDVPTPLQYTPRPPAPAASTDGGPSSTGAVRSAVAAASTAGCWGVGPRDPWSSSIPGLPAPRGGDGAARTRAISHLMYSCSDAGPAVSPAWGLSSAPQPEMQQLEVPGERRLRPSLTGGEGLVSGRGRGLAARAPLSRPSAMGTSSVPAAAAGGYGDGSAAADDTAACLISAASLPGSVASVPLSCVPPHHPPLQRRPHLQLSQQSPVEGGLALRPTPPALCSPLRPSSPSSQPLGTAPYGEGPSSAPPTACSGDFWAHSGTTPAASTEARLLRPPRHLLQPPSTAAAPAAEPPATLAGVAALVEAVAPPWLPPDGSSLPPPRSFGSIPSHLVAPGSNASFRHRVGSAVQHGSPLARHQMVPAAGDAAATADEAGDDGNNVGADVNSSRQLGLGLGSMDPGPRSAASEVSGGGADMPAGGCKGYGVLGSLLPPPPSSEHSAESGEDCSSPFVFSAEMTPAPQTPPPPQFSSQLLRPTLVLPSMGSGYGSGCGSGTQPVLSPTPPACRRSSVGDDRCTPPPFPSPASQPSQLPAVVTMGAGGGAAAPQAPLSPSPQPRGPYTHSTGPAHSSPVPSPQSQTQKQSLSPSPCPQLLYLLAQQLQQQQQPAPRRRAADNKPAAATAAFTVGEADGALAAASSIASAASSPSAASSLASCPDPGTPTGGGGGRQRFVHLLGGVGAKRHSADRHQAFGPHAAATAAAATAAAATATGSVQLQPRGALGAVPEAPSPPLPAAPSGAASSSPSPQPSSIGGGPRGLLLGRPRSRGGGPPVEISADEHRDIMARMKKALSFLKRGVD